MQESIEDNQDSYLIFGLHTFLDGKASKTLVIQQSEKCSPEETFDIRINDLAELALRILLALIAPLRLLELSLSWY